MMLSMTETDYENWRDGLRCGGQEEYGTQYTAASLYEGCWRRQSNKIPMITMRMWWKWPDGSRRFDRAGMQRCGSARPSTEHTSKTYFASMRTCASCEKGA